MTTEAPNLDGIAPCFHSVVERYGRDVFLLVWNAQLAGQAATVLAAQAQKRSSREIAHATGVITLAFNALAGIVCAREGWTQELLAQVDRDCQLAWASSIQPVEKPPIILMQ